MQSNRKKFSNLFFVFVFIVGSQCFAGSTSVARVPPSLSSVKKIYVLGPFDIPDQPVLPEILNDVDGFQDRPRITLWQEDDPVDLSGVTQKYKWVQEEVTLLISDRYKRVSAVDWRNNYHHIPNHYDGGLVLDSGEIVGWLLKAGGLGRLEFNYDERSELVSYWTPKDEIPKQSQFIHLVRQQW